MQVLTLHRRNCVASRFQLHLSRLIQTVDTAAFRPALALAGREVLGCEHVTAFSFGKDARLPRALTLTGSFREPEFHLAAARYAHHHWRIDPTNIFRSRPLTEDQHYVTFLSEHEVADPEYRQDCYSRTGIAHRMSVIKAQGDSFIKLSFHRTQRAGTFRPADMADLLDHVNLLIELVSRHSRSERIRPDAARSVDQYLLALSNLNARLTSREAQVCAGIICGLHSAQIGTTLGVSVNTVRTLRRRAYERLSISSQNELLRLVLR